MRLVAIATAVLLLAIQWPLWFGKGGWLRVSELERQLAVQKTVNAELGERNALLASMTDEQADWVVQQLKALSAQVKAGALFDEQGRTGAEPDPFDGMAPRQKLDAMASKRASEKNISYFDALREVGQENPELAKSAGY